MMVYDCFLILTAELHQWWNLGGRSNSLPCIEPAEPTEMRAEKRLPFKTAVATLRRSNRTFSVPALYHVDCRWYIYIYRSYKICIYIYGCVFFSGVQILVSVGSSSSANHTHESYPEPYPESYLRIIPPKITIMNVSFGIVWDCMASLVLMDVTSQLTSVGQIRWSLAAFTYLHDMSGEAGWLARWLAAWLARLGSYGNCCCWLGGWL